MFRPNPTAGYEGYQPDINPLDYMSCHPRVYFSLELTLLCMESFEHCLCTERVLSP